MDSIDDLTPQTNQVVEVLSSESNKSGEGTSWFNRLRPYLKNPKIRPTFLILLLLVIVGFAGWKIFWLNIQPPPFIPTPTSTIEPTEIPLKLLTQEIIFPNPQVNRDVIINNKIVYIKEGDIVAADPNNGQAQTLVSNALATKIKISPSGRYLGWIFGQEIGGYTYNHGVYSYDLFTKDLKLLIKPYPKDLIEKEIIQSISQGLDNLKISLHDFDWYPLDEGQLAYSRNGLWLISRENPDLGKQLVLPKEIDWETIKGTQLPWRIAYSPNGKYIITDISFYEGFTFSLLDVSTNYSEKEAPPVNTISDLPRWSPDGRYLLWGGSVSLSGSMWPPALFVAPITNIKEDVSNVIVQDMIVQAWDWSSKNNQIALAGLKMFPEGNKKEGRLQGPLDIFLVNPDGSGLKSIINTGEESLDLLQWAPDGAEIIYYSFYQGRLWAVKADGSGKRKLAEGISSPVWVK